MSRRAAGERHPVAVTMPAEIDAFSKDRACGLLAAAFRAGASVVIADFTDTVFWDCAGARSMIAAGRRAAAQGVELVLVIPPGGAVRRVADALNLDRSIPVYPGLREVEAVQAAGARAVGGRWL